MADVRIEAIAEVLAKEYAGELEGKIEDGKLIIEVKKS